MTKTLALLVLGATAVLVGVVAIRLGHPERLARADAHSFWGWFSRPYRVLERPRLAGSRPRYFRQIGWLLVLLGLLVFAGTLRGLWPEPSA